MQQDDIEILAAGHAKFYGTRAIMMADEIIKILSFNEDWDEVLKWNRVKIRIKRRQLTGKGDHSFFTMREQ